MHHHLLTLLALFPAAAGLALFLVPDAGARALALAISLLELVGAVAMAVRLQPVAGWQFEEQHAWLSPLHVSWHVGVDGISGYLVLAVALMTVLGLIAVPRRSERAPHQGEAFGSPYPVPGRAFYYWMLAFSSGMIGALVSLDLLVFYVFWELMLLPAFFLVGLWGGSQRKAATIKFALMTLVGSLTMLAAILYLGAQASAAGAAWPFDYVALLGLHLSSTQEILLFLGFMAAFVVKIPLFPFHVWLPGAYGEAPTAAVFLMSGVMAKLGAYGLIRFAIPLFPHAALSTAGWWSALAVVGIIYGAFLALGQGDAKQVIAYSSFSHLGWITLGLFAFDTVGVTGGVYQMLSHAVATGALFLLIGMLWERKQTGVISRFGGLAHSAPVMATCFVVVALASVGLPGLNGFVGEFMILLGTWGQSPVRAILGATGVVLGAAYLLFLVQRLMFGPASASSRIADLQPREALAVVPLVALTVVMGLWPAPLLARIEPAAGAVVAEVHRARSATDADALLPAATRHTAQANGFQSNGAVSAAAALPSHVAAQPARVTALQVAAQPAQVAARPLQLAARSLALTSHNQSQAVSR